MLELTPRKICPDFDKWPDSWEGVPEDLEYGRKLLGIFEPFCEDLIKSGQAKSTVRRHMDNLWILGGELIRDINEDEQWRNRPVMDLIMEEVTEYEGPYCRHLESESEMNSFDATCRKLYKFLVRRSNENRTQ